MSCINTTPWMEALESQLDALRLVTTFLEHADPRVRQLKGWNVDRTLLRSASPFAWSDEVVQAVMQAGRSIPLDTPLNRWNLETEAAWWHFEKPLPHRTVTDATLGIRALCFGWIPTSVPDFGLPICAWIDEMPDSVIRSRVSPSQTFEWARGETLGEMLIATRKDHVKRYGPNGPDRNEPQIGIEHFMETTEMLARFVLAGIAWLGQKVVVTSDGHVERHRRKEFMRASGRNIPSVRIVQLRRASYQPTPMDARGEPTEWTCRWVVGGHWRNQACGSKHGDRKLTYILPYVKGPDDKPFKVQQAKGYVVNR